MSWFRSSPRSADANRPVKVAEVALRALLCGLGALAAALVATDTQIRSFFSLQMKASCIDTKAIVFLGAATAAAAGYSLLVQAARFCVALAMSSGGGMVPGRLQPLLAWCVFSCDWPPSPRRCSVVAKRGQPELQWMGICALYGAFCRPAGACVANAVAAGLAAARLAFLSAFNLSSGLYGSKSCIV